MYCICLLHLFITCYNIQKIRFLVKEYANHFIHIVLSSTERQKWRMQWGHMTPTCLLIHWLLLPHSPLHYIQHSGILLCHFILKWQSHYSGCIVTFCGSALFDQGVICHHERLNHQSSTLIVITGAFNFLLGDLSISSSEEFLIILYSVLIIFI